MWTDDNGTFEFINIPPANYVIILGNIQLSNPDIFHNLCQDDACDIVDGVWQVNPNEVLEVGRLDTYKKLLVYRPLTGNFYFSAPLDK